jgi:2-dehydro-3-deoxyglucarate aldolase/4-hydroxy-2-oxoheptanedioate aldolase
MERKTDTTSMRVNQVKKALAEGKTQLGTSTAQIRSVEVARLLAAAGFNWTFIDSEHGPFDLETLHDYCRVANLSGLCPIVRVSDLQYSLIARALDIGAQGVLFPRVESPDLLEKAVSWAKFPPAGIRGYGLGAWQVDYEAHSFSEIIEHVNANTMVVLQIETKRAFEAREELLSVKGIDAVMVGPADLSISLGVPGEFQHPRVVETMEAIRDTCNARGIAPGTQTRTVQLAKFWKERGMRFLGCGSEIGMMFGGASEIIKQLAVDEPAVREQTVTSAR